MNPPTTWRAAAEGAGGESLFLKSSHSRHHWKKPIEPDFSLSHQLKNQITLDVVTVK
jgi:hypothetical protein